MFQVTDGGGNVWFNQEKEEDRLNHGYHGAHLAIPFQCEDCWMINLERRLPVSGLDVVYVSLIRRANLDAMAGRAKSTISGHVAATLQTVNNCTLIQKTPTIEARGPMPLTDLVGMEVAVEMIVYSLTAVPQIKSQRFYSIHHGAEATRYVHVREGIFTPGFGRRLSILARLQ